MASQIDNVHRQRHARLLHLVKFGFVEFLFHCVWSHSHSKSTGGWKKWFWALQKIFSRVASYQLTIGLPCDDSPREGANRESHLSRPPHRKPESFALQGWFQKKKNLHATRMRTRTSDIRCCVHAHIHLAIFMASGHALRNYWDKHRWSLAWPTYVSQATLQRLLKYSLLVWRRILFLIVNMWSLFWGLDFSVL